MNAVIDGRKITFADQTLSMEDLDSKEIENYFKLHIKEYAGGCTIVNEAFLKYAHLQESLKRIVSDYQITSITVRENPDQVLLACIQDILNPGYESVLRKLKVIFRQHIRVLASCLYLLFKIVKGNKVERNPLEYSGFYVSRAKADIKMVHALKDQNVCRLYDSYGETDSFYRFFTRKKRINLLGKALLRANRELKEYHKFIQSIYGIHCAYEGRDFYSIRIVQTLLYELCVMEIASNFPDKDYYTADNLDRFALIQEKVAKENGTRLVCIPHGIEYGFMLPHCFVGDIFYTTSEYASSYLSKSYKSEKFTFNPKIAMDMFGLPHEISKQKKFVYFTESREPYVNVRILESIIPVFKKSHVDLFVKFHPADNLKEYASIMGDLKTIEKLDEAISNSICIARKSTVLIEAMYNDSSAIAILENQKDKEIFDTFPSLQDEKILKVESLDELKEIIEKMISA